MAYRQNAPASGGGSGSGAMSMPNRQVCPSAHIRTLSSCLVLELPAKLLDISYGVLTATSCMDDLLQGKMGTVSSAQDLSEKLEVCVYVFVRAFTCECVFVRALTCTTHTGVPNWDVKDATGDYSVLADDSNVRYQG